MIAHQPIVRKKRSPVQGKFSILIPSWNNLDYLRLCIESIRKNSHFTHQVIVHINEGKDGTLDWVDSQPDLSYTFSEKNIGICYALNAGRELAMTDYIVYMNDDMYVCPGWDLVLYDEIEKIGHPYFFLSATAVEPMETGNPCVLVKDYGNNIGDFKEEALLQEYAAPVMRDWQGATWPPNVVHKDVWDLVGGYSIEFSPGMYSDPDFSMKLWLLGVRLFKGVGNSRVYHFGSKSTKRIVVNKGYYQFLSKWALTTGAFTKYYLRRGESFDGPLQDPVLPFSLRVKNFFKRLDALFRSTE
ncbi:MAG TPA: glycosyltransferase [Puia sp.]|nr:glycosyltransferase [Puia sp.]